MSNNTPKNSSHCWIYVVAGLATLSVCVSYSLRGEPFTTKSEVWGQFGDYIGGVLNPVFGFLTLMAVLKTISLQQQELSEARKVTEDLRQFNNDQISEAKRTADIDCFLRAASILQDETLRSQRAALIRLWNKKTPIKEWGDGERIVAECVCSAYDLVGILLKKKLLPKDMILDAWCDSIKKSWEAAKILVDSRRDRDGHSLWSHFEWLNNEAVNWKKTEYENVDSRASGQF